MILSLKLLVRCCLNLPGELSSALCVCEYLSKPFIRITTVKGVTSIEGIETMFCLWSFDYFHKTTNKLWIENSKMTRLKGCKKYQEK